MIRKRLFKSTGFKIFTFYIFLSLINLSFIISIVFENQVELIGKNTMLESEKQISGLIGAMKKLSFEMRKGDLFNVKTENDRINQLLNMLNPRFKEFAIISEGNKIIYKSEREAILPENCFDDARRSLTTLAFSGKDYYLRVDEEKNSIYFYIPLNLLVSEDHVLFVRLDIKNLGRVLTELYKQSFYIIAVVLFFHLIFAAFIYWSFILPINRLSAAAVRFYAGDLATRVEITGRSYELDSLASAFNEMADAIHENINTLSNEVETVKSENRRRGEHSTRDELTGMLNSKYFNERIDDELRHLEIRNGGFSVMLIEIDGYDRMFQIYGKQTSDIIITEVARRILQCCTAADTAARIGNERFAVLSFSDDQSYTAGLARKISESVSRKEIVTPDGNITATVRTGKAFVEKNAVSGRSDILNSAENEMIRA